MTPEKINTLCAEFMGVETHKHICVVDGSDDPDDYCVMQPECPDSWDNCIYASPDGKPEDCKYWVPANYCDYYHTSAALELLGELVQRGYRPILTWDDDWSDESKWQWECVIESKPYDSYLYSNVLIYADTPSAAIATAVAELQGREKG